MARVSLIMFDDRIKRLNDAAPDDGGSYVLYWMQQAHRADFNHALEFAIRKADDRGQPVIVGFGLMDDYPEAHARHYAFMLQGLAEARAALHARGIKFVIRRGQPKDVAWDLARDASLVVCDRAYLRHLRSWRDHIADLDKAVFEVESETVVPVDVASDKAEFAARTIRPKLMQRWEDYRADPGASTPKLSSLPLHVTSDVDLADVPSLLDGMDIDRSVKPVSRFRGGATEARKLLKRFIAENLTGYNAARNDPADPQCSNLSPYLHFGQISPLEIIREIRDAGAGEDRDAFLEELIVRRELAHNFVVHHPAYDSFDCLPDWARKTLAEHADDDRPTLYAREQLETAKTDDPYWNAAMLEMLKTGYMHNHMRMYWGKKILEWMPSAKEAYETALSLNNKYFLDGGDPNSYAGVAWIFGLHDRPWQERPIFGKVRYMNAAGLKRKFDIEAYVKAMDRLDWPA